MTQTRHVILPRRMHYQQTIPQSAAVDTEDRMRALNLTLVLALAVTACMESDATAPAIPAIAPQFSAAPAFGTTTDIEDLLGQPTLDVATGFDNGFRRQVVNQWDDPAALRRIFSRWLTTLVLARLQPANTDTKLFAALADFDA